MKRFFLLGFGILFIITLKAQNVGSGETIQFDIKQLAVTKAKVQSGDKSVMDAYKKLIASANKILSYKPVSVMDKVDIPPSGNKHDYVSLAPYWWPNPNTPNGLPYIRKDGEINPEVKNYPDKQSMPRLCGNIYLLGIAYYLSGNEQYAKKVNELMTVWFLDTATLMNPNLNFAQYIKGVNSGRGIGIIDTRHFVYALESIQLIKGSSNWDDQKNNATKKWFAQFLHWLQTSENGLEEMKADNNHGVWYDFQCLGIALYLDSNDLAKKIINRSLQRLDEQSNSEHFFPLELARTNSLHYSVFNLVAFSSIAQLAEKVGVNFWEKETVHQHSLKKSYTALLPYIKKEKTWTGNEVTPYYVEEAFNLLLHASEKYDCTSCKVSIQNFAGENYKNLLLQLF